MGHDYITFRDSHLHLNDFDLLTLRHLLLHCARLASPESLGTDRKTLDELRSFLDAWEWIGPGVFAGVELDNFTSDDPNRVELLRKLLVTTRQYVDKFGDVIPLEYLDANVSTRAVRYTVDQPTATFRDAIAGIISLLDHRL